MLRPLHSGLFSHRVIGAVDSVKAMQGYPTWGVEYGWTSSPSSATGCAKAEVGFGERRPV